MQKQKLDYTPFLALQSTDKQIEVGFFKDNHLIETIHVPKMDASALFIEYTKSVLARHQLSILDIAFCVVNRGPSPFTLLRTLLAYVNGLQAAINMQLIGVDGLDACAHEYSLPDHDTLVIQNAFSQQFYYGFKKANDSLVSKGCASIDQFHTLGLSAKEITPIVIVGNGYELFSYEIQKALLHRQLIVQNPMPTFSTIEYIGKIGHRQWLQTKVLAKAAKNMPLMPLYLKPCMIFSK